MGINWISSTGRATNQTADLEVRYSNGKVKQYAFTFTQGAHATKLKNAERLMVGANDSLTRLYFAPVNENMATR